MGSIVDAANAIAQQLTATGRVKATNDPRWASAHRPCVLVAPPAMNYQARTNTWRLYALSKHAAGTLDALTELDELVAVVVDVLPVEAADPVSYALTPETGTVPAYMLRITT